MCFSLWHKTEISDFRSIFPISCGVFMGICLEMTFSDIICWCEVLGNFSVKDFVLFDDQGKIWEHIQVIKNSDWSIYISKAVTFCFESGVPYWISASNQIFIYNISLTYTVRHCVCCEIVIFGRSRKVFGSGT